MSFKRAHFRLNDNVTLGKGNIRAINNILATVGLMDKHNYKLMLDLLAEDGFEVGESITYLEGSAASFNAADITHKGKRLGSIFSYFIEETKLDLADVAAS